MEMFNLPNKWFDFFFYFCILNGSLAWLEINFFGKFINKSLKWVHYFTYVLMMYFLYATEIQLRVSFPNSTILELAALFGFGCLILRCTPALSAITAILTISMMQVVNGIFQSLSSIIYAFSPYMNAVLLICNLLAITFCYRYVVKSFDLRKTPMNPYVLILLLPILFVLLVVQYVFMTTAAFNRNGARLFSSINDWEMLLIQIAAFVCLLAVLFAYQKLSEAFELQMRNTLLEQQVDTQKDYMQEVQTRYEQTRAFRHDIKSHWTVLRGLLKTGENEKASEYLNKLEMASDTFSFPCQTGNMVIDMLLSSKLGLAQQKGIRVDCTMKIPSGDAIDEMDLCIIFSNAVDNAIKACTPTEGSDQYIIIYAVQKGDFFMIEIENSCNGESTHARGSGIGLRNIRAVAEKYNGAVSVESTPQMYKLNVLLSFHYTQTASDSKSIEMT
ncbi:sensor histidine kinase [Paenibacillus sp. BAC0078]